MTYIIVDYKGTKKELFLTIRAPASEAHRWESL